MRLTKDTQQIFKLLLERISTVESVNNEFRENFEPENRHWMIITIDQIEEINSRKINHTGEPVFVSKNDTMFTKHPIIWKGGKYFLLNLFEYNRYIKSSKIDPNNYKIGCPMYNYKTIQSAFNRDNGFEYNVFVNDDTHKDIMWTLRQVRNRATTYTSQLNKEIEKQENVVRVLKLLFENRDNKSEYSYIIRTEKLGVDNINKYGVFRDQGNGTVEERDIENATKELSELQRQYNIEKNFLDNIMNVLNNNN